MRWRLRKAVIPLLGLLLMAGSTLLYIRFLQHYRASLTVMETIKPIRLLQAGEKVREELLRRVSIPIAAHDSGAGVTPADVVGKTVLVPIGPEEELASWKLDDQGIVASPGERYYAFKTDKLENDANLIRRGDRVDVWVEFDTPEWLKDTAGARRQVGSIKLIENLLVAGVKTAEGLEVMDTAGIGQVLSGMRSEATRNRAEVSRSRASPNGAPELNLYLMSEDVYNAYTLGAIGGRIKLALTNWNRLPKEGAAAKLTDMFLQLRESDIFTREKKSREVTVQRVMNDQVTAEGAATGSLDANKGGE